MRACPDRSAAIVSEHLLRRPYRVLATLFRYYVTADYLALIRLNNSPSLLLLLLESVLLVADQLPPLARFLGGGRRGGWVAGWLGGWGREGGGGLDYLVLIDAERS